MSDPTHCVLVIEDSATHAEHLALVLESGGYEVEIVGSGVQGLAHCRQFDVDLVITDVMMPGMSGFEVCRKLKAEPQTSGIPVLLVTVLDDPRDMVEGLVSGADNYLTKPYEPDQILDRVRRLLEDRPESVSDRAGDAVEVSFLGKHYQVGADREQILRLLLPIFEEWATRGSAPDVTGPGRTETGDAGQSGAPSPGGAPAGVVGTARILAVEDSPTQAAQLQKLLETAGYEVELTANASEALERYRRSSFDLVVTDVVLPDLTGYDLCRRIKAQSAESPVPVILVTGLDDPVDVIRGLECGADNFLVKPYQEDQLLVRVRTCLHSGPGDDSRSDAMGVETTFRGQQFIITAGKAKMLDYLVSTFEDISRTRELVQEANLGEKVAQQTSQFLQKTLDALSAHIAILDESGTVVAVNRAWRQFAQDNGYRGEGLGVGENYLSICTLATRNGDPLAAKVIDGIGEVVDSRRDLFYLEYPCHSSEEERWFSLQVTRFEDEASGRVVVAHENITERRRSEEALRASEGKYRGLVENVPHGIYRSTPEGRILAVNPALLTMLGYESEEELFALNLEQDVYVDPGTRQREQAVHEGGGLIRDFNVDWRRKDGSQLAVRLNGRSILNEAGEVDSYEMIAEDVTERRLLEEELRQAQKMEAVGQLSGGIAHDFNNILSVILTNADLIADEIPPDNAEVLEDLGDISSAARRGAAMVKQLLGFSRRETLDLGPVDLGEVVTGTAKMLRTLLPETIELRHSADARGLKVWADAGAMRQILLNLVTNARDAMPNGGLLLIGCYETQLDEEFCAAHAGAKPGRYVCVSFGDTGTGMDEETRTKIFDPFFTTKEPGAGTGLGMSMVYGLVKQLKGYLALDSELGEGTTFRIYLPVMDEEANDDDRQEVAVEVASGTETVLVVEDEPGLRRLARRILEKHGYTVFDAGHGEEGLDLVLRHSDEIDLVVADVVMPKMGGPALRDALVGQGVNKRFLFTSGYTARDVRGGSRIQDDDELLRKPWTIADFLSRVRESLDRNPL